MIASFNDTRCGYGGVCSNDPLLFTCNITGSPATTVIVTFPPSGDIIILNDDNSIQGMIPEGYTLQSAIVSMNDSLNNFILTFSIESASLLNGSDIICNSGLTGGRVMAGCPVARKFSIHIVHVQCVLLNQRLSYASRVNACITIYPDIICCLWLTG